MTQLPPKPTLFPYTTLFRSAAGCDCPGRGKPDVCRASGRPLEPADAAGYPAKWGGGAVGRPLAVRLLQFDHRPRARPLSYTCTPNARSANIIANMRTLQSQVKLRRLIRSTSEAITRLRWEPSERAMAGSIVGRLLEMAAEVRESWAQEALSGRPGEPLSAFVAESR